jgi:hypothetical protein
LSELEKIPQGEDAAVDEILRLTLDQLHKANPPGKKPVLRDAHAKHHGLVRAELSVRPGLPRELAVGVFREPRTFRAYVRFSNSVGHIGDDHEPQTRGMAIKLLGVEGDKILPEERNETTQDFVLLTHPQFPVADVFEYITFMNAVFSGKPVWFFLNGLNPLRWRLREFLIVHGMRTQEVANPLTAQYFSATPFLLGERAMKFSLRPIKEKDGAAQEERISDSPDYLREAMARTLSQREASFEFLVQLRESDKDPIEDPRIPWRGPWQPVATLRIPRQPFQSPAQMAFAEHLSFTSWHSLPEHRPLGGVNRARRKVYQVISEHRHRENGVPRREPTGDESFE